MTPPVVLLHGWGYTPAIWRELASLLPELAVSTPHLLAPEGSLADWADQLAPTLPDRAVIVGWSLGAMLALSLAARHPQKVAHLVLLSASSQFVADSHWPHGLPAATVQQFCEGFARDARRTLRRFVALQALGDAQRQALTARLEAALDNPQAQAVALQRGLALLASSTLHHHLPKPTLPCTLIHGRADAVMPFGAAQALQQHFCHGRLIALDDVGHAPYFTQPEPLATLIQEIAGDLA